MGSLFSLCLILKLILGEDINMFILGRRAVGKNLERHGSIYIMFLMSKEPMIMLFGGCTEIPLILKKDHIDVPFLDSLKILAKAAVKYAGLEPI